MFAPGLPGLEIRILNKLFILLLTICGACDCVVDQFVFSRAWPIKTAISAYKADIVWSLDDRHRGGPEEKPQPCAFPGGVSLNS